MVYSRSAKDRHGAIATPFWLLLPALVQCSLKKGQNCFAGTVYRSPAKQFCPCFSINMTRGVGCGFRCYVDDEGS